MKRSFVKHIEDPKRKRPFSDYLGQELSERGYFHVLRPPLLQLIAWSHVDRRDFVKTQNYGTCFNFQINLDFLIVTPMSLSPSWDVIFGIHSHNLLYGWPVDQLQYRVGLDFVKSKVFLQCFC